MVEAGAFEEVGRAAVAELLYWQLRGDETGGEERRAAAPDPAELAARRATDCRRLIAHYDRPQTAYRARPRPDVAMAGRLRPSGAARRMDLVSPPAATRRLPPTAAQRRAAEPACSIWVTASAGTGKTRVLADRVLRLLLAGSAPRQLLCLTFTKAAAAEMVARVQQELGRLATSPEQQLASGTCGSARPRRHGRGAGARAHSARRGPRPARRPADHDHPRLLPVAAQALPARGGRRAPFRGARPAQRRRSAARGAGGGAGEQPQRHPRRARPPRRAAGRGDPGRRPECAARGPAPPGRGLGAATAARSSG